jgi:hypothetical protein
MTPADVAQFVASWVRTRVSVLVRTAPLESPIWFLAVIALGVVLVVLLLIASGK